MIIVYFSSFCILTYCILILKYKQAFSSYLEFNLKNESPAEIFATILITCRNPSSHLEKLIFQIKHQIKSEKIELLILDDFSDKRIEQFENKMIRLHEHRPDLNSKTNNKKQAIALGVELAKYDTIICLDADVILSDNWWLIISNFIAENQPKFAAGLHRFNRTNSLLNSFIHIEQDIMTACSIASLNLQYPTMCNGANMVFSKSAFNAVNGYDGLYHTTGGDDLFLYHRIFDKFPSETFYIKNIESSAWSDAPKDFTSLIQQRVRWISKSPSYENWGIQIQSIIILLANLVCLLAFFIPILLPLFLFKSIIELNFIFKLNIFYKSNYRFINYLILFTFYPFFILFIILICIKNSLFKKSTS